MTCNHNYINGKCIYCNKEQPVFNNGKERVFEKIKPITIKKKKITSEFQYMTDKLITYLGVPVKEFPRFAKYVKKLGVKNIPRIIGEIKETDKWCLKEHGNHLKKVGYFINKFIKNN